MCDTLVNNGGKMQIFVLKIHPANQKTHDVIIHVVCLGVNHIQLHFFNQFQT